MSVEAYEWIPSGVEGVEISIGHSTVWDCTYGEVSSCDQDAATLARATGHLWGGDALCDEHLSDVDELRQMAAWMLTDAVEDQKPPNRRHDDD